jgi:hypothetical protein
MKNFQMHLLIVLLTAVISYGTLPVTNDLILNLDGDHVAADGTSVSAMLDQSGRGNNALATYSGYYPYLSSGTANGHNAVDFTSSTGKAILEIVGNADFNSLSKFTLFAVYKYPTPDPYFGTNYYIMSGSYKMSEPNGVSWETLTNDHGNAGTETTWALYSNGATLRSQIYKSPATYSYESLWPYRGYKGWNLLVMTWDPNNDTTVDGNTDLHYNASSDQRDIVWAKSTEDPNRYQLKKFVRMVIGGRIEYFGSVGDDYLTGYYDMKSEECFGGMIAEVAMYSKVLSESSIQSVSEYLVSKYNCGSAGELMNLSTKTDCEYLKITGDNFVSDMNGDCKIDFKDIAEFSQNWLVSY